MLQRACRGGTNKSYLLQVMALLLIVLLPHCATAHNTRMTSLRGRVLHSPDSKFYEIPWFKIDRDVVDVSEDTNENDEPHPADELLQLQDADGSQSYILGGY